MAVTLEDIARQVGVTRATVSRVLSGKGSAERISSRTQRRVLDAAESLGYRPSLTARGLAKGRTYSLGLVCGHMHNPHFSELASAAMAESEDRGYHLLISVPKWEEASRDLTCLDTLLGRGVDGVLFYGSAIKTDTRQYEYIVGERFPFVMGKEDVKGLASVSADWRPGMAELIRRLKGRGHRRVGFIGGCDASGYDPEEAGPRKRTGKLEAFVAACREQGIDWTMYSRFDPADVEAGERFGYQLASSSDRPTAVVAYSDYAAAAVSWGLRSGGVRIPADMALVGLDGTAMGRYVHPALTSVEQDRRGMVRCAIDMLIGMIENGTGFDADVQTPTRLIVRESA